MDFSTLVDLDDFFEDEVVSASNDLFGEAFDIGAIIGDEETYEPVKVPEVEPLPEFKPEEYATSSYGEIEETPVPEPTIEAPRQESVLRSPEEEAKVEEIRSEIRQITERGDKNEFMDYWKKLPEKEKDLLFRATVGAIGGGAREILRGIQQSRAQEFQRESSERAAAERSAAQIRSMDFQREMTDRDYAERRAREDREREARRVAGTPQAMSFNVAPRGIIGQGMGG